MIQTLAIYNSTSHDASEQSAIRKYKWHYDWLLPFILYLRMILYNDWKLPVGETLFRRADVAPDCNLYDADVLELRA